MGSVEEGDKTGGVPTCDPVKNVEDHPAYNPVCVCVSTCLFVRVCVCVCVCGNGYV